MINFAHAIDERINVSDIECFLADCRQADRGAEVGGRGSSTWCWGIGCLIATSFEERFGMWSNIALYLKYGRKFIGAFSGFDPNAMGLLTGTYGAGGKITDRVADGKGVRMLLSFATDPSVKFDMFMLEK